MVMIGKQAFNLKLEKKVVDLISTWGGKVIDVPYTLGISSTKLNQAIKEIGTTPDIRRRRLKRLIENKGIVKVCEAHNGLSGLVVENTEVNNGGFVKSFDGIWVSSLTQATARGKPDTGYLDTTSRTDVLHDILEVSTKPIIYDGDNGGPIPHFCLTVKTLERLGVSAIIIEDKIGLKKNSLFGTEVVQNQDNEYDFASKISAGKSVCVADDFMIIARIESLILDKSVDDAIHRAKTYIEAGADAIMIHSRKKNFSEIESFCNIYNNLTCRKPLVVVPSSYSHVTEEELKNKGVNVVIYANQLLRSAYPAMIRAAESILEHERAEEAEHENCISIRDFITVIPGG